MEDFSNTLYSAIKPVIEMTLPESNEEVLVLGTEEFMFAPLMFGKLLGEKHHISVQFHATTRSPIETSDFANYAISRRFPIASCYDSSRNTFVYNLKRYDKVYIVTDVVPNTQFLLDISSAFTLTGTEPKDIIVIVLKG